MSSEIRILPLDSPQAMLAAADDPAALETVSQAIRDRFSQGVMPAETDEEGAIVGSPVSPGVVEGVVRVVLNPHEVQLEPGEIMVCPGADPAWTPLFLVAAGRCGKILNFVSKPSNCIMGRQSVPASLALVSGDGKWQKDTSVKSCTLI